MTRPILVALVSVLALSLTPQPVAAQTGQVISVFFGLFNAFAGIMLTLSILFFVGGLGSYFFRLGLETRTDSIRWMEHGTSLLIALILLLAIVRLIQSITAIPVTDASSFQILIAVLLVYYGGKWILKNLELWNLRVMVKK